MKYLIYSVLMSAALSAAVSCGGLTGEDDSTTPVSGNLTISLSASVIQADGEDASVINVMLDGTTVTEGVTIYDASTNKPLDLPDMVFTTTVSGTYSFWAAYGTEHSSTVTLRAIDFSVPVLPEDPEPDNLSFTRKCLVTQFTGTGCGYCPFMVLLLRDLMEDEEYSSRFVLAAAHTYSSSDPAYLSSRLDQAMGVNSYPNLVIDMKYSYGNYNSYSGLTATLDQAYSECGPGTGIAVSTGLEGNTAVIRVSVKAAETGEYRIGAWLLEDGIYGRQSNYGAEGDFDTHDNCIRVADSKVSASDFSGHSLGTLEKGTEAEYVFVIDIEDGWVKENCHLVVFTSVLDGRSYRVCNAVSCGLSESLEYSYE